MTLLAVLQEPDPRLHKSSRHIELIDHEIRRLARDMLDTMYHRGGCGLAAPQVNTRLRMIVIDTSSRADSPLTLVNPIIEYRSTRMARFEEGCLSIPDLTAAMHRPAEIVISAIDLAGKQMELEASGWLGAVIQHEIDHLNGRLLTDALSPKDRSRYFKGHRSRR